ncbi:MAG: hypothetical protein ACE5H0_00510 [Bacteroidota bacterium]
MKHTKTYAIVALLSATTSSVAGEPFLLGTQAYHHEIKQTKEKEVRVSLESAFGKVFITKGVSDKILIADFQDGKRSGPGVEISYYIEDNVGHLEMEPGDWAGIEKTVSGKEWKVPELESGAWYLKFTDSVPLAFNIELGVGEGDFDLTGLSVKEFKMSAGASKVTVHFDEPNRSIIEHMEIESGVSRFKCYNLGNANFRTLSFSGGIGSYTLDFGGELRKEVNVNIKVGLGAVTLILPPDVGARVIAEESWLSKLDVDRGFSQRRSGEYVSDNYNSADGRMQIDVEAGLGSVKIKRSR